MQPAPSQPPAGPLLGVKVVDFSRYLPGPYCTLQLAQLGAEVLAVERPPAGDPMKALPPADEDGVGLFYRALHVGKTTCLLDLQDDEGLAAALALCETADVVVETFRPGVAERLGVGPEALRTLNPQLVYCSISGYGQTGPWRDVPGHDANYLSAAGLQDRIGPAEHPVPAPLPLADIAAGSMAATAVCAALVERAQTGEGCVIDMSMTEAAAALAHHVFPAADDAGTGRGRGVLNGDLACFSLYECADRRFLAVSAIEPHFFARFCELVGLPGELAARQLDPEAQDEIRARIAARLKEQTADQWQALLATEDTCVSKVMTLAEAVEHPQLVARGAIEYLDPAARSYPVPASPFVIDGQRTRAGAP